MLCLNLNPLLLTALFAVTHVACAQEDLASKTGKLIEELCQKDRFSGTVLIAQNDQVLFEVACGEASKRFHIPNNIDTKFNLGSMNKMFTAIAILQLVEQSKLELHETIEKYVDESWLPKEITQQITIHHLLSHTSGLGSYFNETYRNSSREQFRKVSDYKALVRGDKPSFAPGERFQYSNTGMLLLGVVIEKISKRNYFEYVRGNIYEPAEMMSTDSYEMDQPVENLAIGYTHSEDNEFGWENNLFKHVIKGGPAGGGFSTVRDLHKFSMALTGEKLLSKSSLKLLWKSHTSRYGYGFSLRASQAGKVVGHGGGFPGINSNLDIFPDSNYIVIVMSNYSSAASPVAEAIRHFIEEL
ncbi:MAG: serine hydrolase domain-containing protein [Cyclobacteriaceae bacterium]